ncbi:MAG: CARDB domain-containing protein [Bryobacterales bacterium]
MELDGAIRRVTTGADGIVTGEPDEVISTVASGLSLPADAALDAVGNLFIAEQDRILRITPGADGLIDGSVDELLTSIAGTAPRASGDGGPATAAQFDNTIALAFDSFGNLFVSDSLNRRIRRIEAGADGLIDGAPDEVISTVVGTGVFGYSGEGGPPNLAQIKSAAGIAFDSAGSLYFADLAEHRVRRVLPGTDGEVTGDAGEVIATIAGVGVPAFGGDGLTANLAGFNSPRGVAVDANGNIFVADFNNRRIRFIEALDTDGDGAPDVIDPCPADPLDSCLVNTPVGTNVTVTPEDTTSGGAPVTVTFAQVTQEGDTSLTTSSAGPPPPEGFKLGAPPVYYDLATTAQFVPPVTICIAYTGVSFADEAALSLFHFESGVWEDRTTLRDPNNDRICAVVSSLSPFAIFGQQYPNQAELIGVGLTATPVVQGNGRIDIQLAASVKNNGGVDAEAVRVRFARSADGGLTFQNIGSALDLGAIPEGQATLAQQGWNNVALGSYIFQFTVDPNNSVAEGDETNNVSTFPLVVTSDLLADLIPVQVNAIPQGDGGGNIDVSLEATIRNIGAADAANVGVGFETSADGGVTFQSVGSLLNAGSITAAGEVVATRLFNNAAPGDYLVRLTVDPNQQISEKDEANNQAVFPFHIGNEALADLSVVSLSSSAAPDTSGNIDVTL